MFDRIAIESHRATPDPQTAHALLTQKAMEAGVARFADPAQIEAFLARVDFASQHAPIPPLGPDSLERALGFARIRPEEFRRTGSCRQRWRITERARTSIAPGRPPPAR